MLYVLACDRSPWKQVSSIFLRGLFAFFPFRKGQRNSIRYVRAPTLTRSLARSGREAKGPRRAIETGEGNLIQWSLCPTDRLHLLLAKVDGRTEKMLKSSSSSLFLHIPSYSRIETSKKSERARAVTHKTASFVLTQRSASSTRL